MSRPPFATNGLRSAAFTLNLSQVSQPQAHHFNALVASGASRIRATRLRPSTVAHVLTLVRPYIGANSNHSRRPNVQHTRIIESSHPSSLNESQIKGKDKESPSRLRFHSTAVVHVDDSDSPNQSSSNLLRRSLTSANQPIPSWASLPTLIHQKIESQAYFTASEFISSFESAQCRPVTLSPPSILIRVFRLFRQTSTTDDQWEWLANTLFITLQQHAESKEIVGTPSLARAVRAVCLAKLGRWEDAIKAMAKSFLNVPSFHDYSPLDLEVYTVYTNLLRQSSRFEDVAGLVRYSGVHLQKFLTGPRTTLTPRSTAQVLFENIKADIRHVPEPIAWIQKQFAEAGDRPVVVRTASAFILAFTTEDPGELSIALNIHELVQMKTHIYPPSPVSNLALALTSAKRSLEGLRVFDSLLKTNPGMPHASLSAGLIIYASQGKTEAAGEVWRNLTSRYAPTKMDKIQYVISMDEGVQRAIFQLRELFGEDYDLESDIDTLQCLFRVAIRFKATRYAEQYFESLLEMAPSVELYERMLTLYASTAELHNAVLLFDNLLSSRIKPTRRCYVSLMSAFANRADSVSAQSVFDAMCDQGIEPNEVAWATLINAHIEAGDYVSVTQRCKDIPPEMLAHPSLTTAVLKAFVYVAAPIGIVMPIFRLIDKPHPKAWALIIQSAVDNSDLALAKRLFNEFDMSTSNNITGPNVYVFSILLAAYLRAGDADSGRAVYDEMIRRKVLPSSVTYGIIIKSYASNPGDTGFEQAHRFAMSILDIIENDAASGTSTTDKGRLKEDVVGPLLVAAGRSGDIKLAEEYYNIKGHDKPSIPWMAKMMDAYRRGGDVDAVMRTWSQIYSTACQLTHIRQTSSPSVYAKEPFTRSRNNILCISLSIVIKALADAGRYEQIREVWREVRSAGFAFDSQNYNHLAEAMAKLGDIEAAFHIVDRVILPRYYQVKDRLESSIRPSSALDPIPSRSQHDQQADHDDNIASTTKQDEQDDSCIEMYEDEAVAENTTTTINRRKAYLDAISSQPRPSYVIDLDVLGTWRPSDVLWRANHATISTLDQAFAEIEKARSMAMIGVAYDEENDGDVEEGGKDSQLEGGGGSSGQDGEGSNEKPVKNFGIWTSRDVDGKIKTTTPQALFWRLQRKYRRVIALCMLHRRKHADEARRGRR